MDEIVDFYLSTFEEQGIVLTRFKTEPHTFINDDRELLTQLFANLLENTLRHCPKGLHIECRVIRYGNKVIATVADNGLGDPGRRARKSSSSPLPTGEEPDNPGIWFGAIHGESYC